ncbi:MAG: hypothetical protein IKJ17_00115 [Clostridia bacterium]|nr:hypothetical protein [Clostridia bacterium]
MKVIRKGVTTFFTVLIVAALSFYFGYYLINYASDSMNIIKAEKVTVYNSITANGYAVRNEQVIKYNGDGVIVTTKDDGQRVSKGGEVAKIYSSARDAENQALIQKLTKKIHALDTALDGVTYGASSLSELEAGISAVSMKIQALCATGNGTELAEFVDELNVLLSRKNLILADGAERATATSVLESEVRNLKQMSGSSARTIKAQYAGYFVSMTDGYEELLTMSDVEMLTPENVKNLASSVKPDENAIGKIITDYVWEYVFTATHEQTEDMKVGDSVELEFSFTDDNTLPATVKSITDCGDGNDLVVVECSQMTEDMLYIRRQSAKIIKSSVDGIKVDKMAIRVSDGVTGVYVLRGSQVKFVPVDVIHMAEDYYIVEQGTDADALVPSDKVLTGGKDLYDGKQIG